MNTVGLPRFNDGWQSTCGRAQHCRGRGKSSLQESLGDDVVLGPTVPSRSKAMSLGRSSGSMVLMWLAMAKTETGT